MTSGFDGLADERGKEHGDERERDDDDGRTPEDSCCLVTTGFT